MSDTSGKRRYDSTVARMAGNIATGLASKTDYRMSELGEPAEIADWAKSIVLLSVGLSRAIIAEVERTEPKGEKL